MGVRELNVVARFILALARSFWILNFHIGICLEFSAWNLGFGADLAGECGIDVGGDEPRPRFTCHCELRPVGAKNLHGGNRIQTHVVRGFSLVLHDPEGSRG
jgi:hypothetical protein